MLFTLDGEDAVKKESIRHDVSFIANQLKEDIRITDEGVSDAFEKLSKRAPIVAIDIWDTLLINDSCKYILRKGNFSGFKDIRQIHAVALIDDLNSTSDKYSEGEMPGFIHTPFDRADFDDDPSSQSLDVETILRGIDAIISGNIKSS